MLEVTGRWVLVPGHLSLGVGHWALVTGRLVLDLWALDTGRSTLAVGRWPPDAYHWTLDPTNRDIIQQVNFYTSGPDRTFYRRIIPNLRR